MMKKLLLAICLVVLWVAPSWAATHYVSPSASDSVVWSTCTAIGTPCSIRTAFSNAVAGDLVYLRNGTYNMGSSYSSDPNDNSGCNLKTQHSGTGDADAQRIIIRAYPGEVPNIVTNISGATHSDYAGAINIVHDYWTIDGITMTTTGGSPEMNSCILAGYDASPIKFKLLNSTLVLSGGGTSNVATVILHTTVDALVQYNDITGTASATLGIQMFNGTGTKILNNNIHSNKDGIMQKHPNCDTSLSSGYEIAYNYVYDNSRSGNYGRYAYANIHDNIFVGSQAGVDLGDNGGGSCSDGHSVWNHNTTIGEFYLGETGAGSGSTFKNNIVTPGGYEHYGTQPTFSYNLWAGSGWPTGSNNIAGSPTFVGGASPTSIAGYALTSGSLGKGNGDDNKDRGADTTQVGRGGGTGCTGDCTNPTVTITQGSSTTTTVNSITLTGTATDDVGVVQVQWANQATSLGGSCTCTNCGTTSATWSCAVSPLVQSPSTNLVTISAVDAKPNTGQAQITVTYTPPQPPGNECSNYTTSHPEWIFCDDFETTWPNGNALVQSGRFWDYTAPASGGSFLITDGVGVGGSKGIAVLFPSGSVDSTQFGTLMMNFGRNPAGTNGIKTTTDYKEIYWRFYMKLQTGWIGIPLKLTRAAVMTAANWTTGTMNHVWNDGASYMLEVEPTTCIDGSGNVLCTTWNDTQNYSWLGALAGPTPLFDGSHNNTWYRIETHLKLNDAGVSNGILEFWIDGNLEARRTGLNLVDGYSSYGINIVMFPENYGCLNCNQHYRYFDNFVVSTAPIGPIATGGPHTITATATSGGILSPSGSVGVSDGASQAFTMTPSTGFHVSNVVVDGTSVGAPTSYTFSNVTVDHTIAVTFTGTVAGAAVTGVRIQ